MKKIKMKMKMKKKIKLLVVTASLSIMLLTGCGKTILNELGQKVSVMGNYIEISRKEYTDPFGSGKVEFLVYDRNTKIVYRMVTGSYNFSIIELHSYDEEGHPVLQFYKDGRITTELP